jgi:outer membrane immunogenic protein
MSIATAPSQAWSRPPGGFTMVGDRVSQEVDMVTLRLNYLFGGYGLPGTARY